jgi:poly-beta-1,6-N-acetyl-D-glucosamine N-deacetylase PgaB
VAVAFHDVVDDPADLASDAVTTRTLVQFFDWLKADGWTAISLDDLADGASGARRLPDKAILLTFDDAYASLYTRVFPLLKAYRYPAVAALVGSWMEGTPDGTVLYGDDRVPRANFISWDEAREMQASGLVEFASHTYDLHRGVLGNPQGNLTPAAATWVYDPQSRTHETDAQFVARIRADLARSIVAMQAELGRPPRAIAWPFGRLAGPATQVADELGLSFGLALEPEPAFTSNLHLIPRYHPAGNPRLRDLVEGLRFAVAGPQTLRIACLTLDGLAAAGDGAPQEEALGRLIEGLRTLGPNVVVIDAAAAPTTAETPLDVYFPSALRPMRKDLLGRAAWQIGTRGGADIYLHLPLAAAAAAVGDANVPALFAEMARHARAEGVVIDLPATPADASVVANRPEEVRARRAALDPAALDRWTALGLRAYRAAAAINPRLRLMVAMATPGGPPGWADIGLLPPSQDARQAAALVSRLRAQGWLRPDAAGRLAFSLPDDPAARLRALRFAQRQGASAFALCPAPPPLPPPPALATAFSAATYPHKP